VVWCGVELVSVDRGPAKVGWTACHRSVFSCKRLNSGGKASPLQLVVFHNRGLADTWFIFRVLPPKPSRHRNGEFHARRIYVRDSVEQQSRFMRQGDALRSLTGLCP
jgi:hypothetical protein